MSRQNIKQRGSRHGLWRHLIVRPECIAGITRVVWTDLELADNAAVVILHVASLLAAEQFERVQPLVEPVELGLRLQLSRVDLPVTDTYCRPTSACPLSR